MTFRNSEESHCHSLEVLNTLYEYDDFMLSIQALADFGCNSGLDLEWWATRTTRDDNPEPLNIQCTGFDLDLNNVNVGKYPNLTFQQGDFETDIVVNRKKKFDIIWCHDSFQYCLNPLKTLSLWRECTTPGAMLALVIPQTQTIARRQLNFYQPNGCFYHHSVVSLIHQLAITGWDCKSGFFLKRPTDNWLYAIVYKSEHEPMDFRNTTWYDLSEKQLLPDTADASVRSHGYVRQQDLVLPWIDKSLSSLANQ